MSELGKCPTCGGPVSTTQGISCPKCGETNFYGARYEEEVQNASGSTVRKSGYVDTRTGKRVETYSYTPETSSDGCLVAITSLAALLGSTMTTVLLILFTN